MFSTGVVLLILECGFAYKFSAAPWKPDDQSRLREAEVRPDRFANLQEIFADWAAVADVWGLRRMEVRQNTTV